MDYVTVAAEWRLYRQKMAFSVFVLALIAGGCTADVGYFCPTPASVKSAARGGTAWTEMPYT